MDAHTKFNVGDSVFTIDKKTMKIRGFEIGSVFVGSTEKNVVKISYHAKGDSAFEENIPEEHCFPTEKELLAFVSSN